MTSILKNDVENPIAQVIFAHGAGANMTHAFMENFTRLLNERNINVLRFNFPFMDKRAETGKRYPPDRMPKLIACYQEIIETYLSNASLNLKQSTKPLPLFISGKSMGSRVAVTLAGDEHIAKSLQGVFCIGYPFHPVKKPEKLRLEPLQSTLKPVLILQGDRDPLGSEVEIADYEISPLCRCVFFGDGDHDLKPRVKSGFKHDQHLEEAASAIEAFVKQK